MSDYYSTNQIPANYYRQENASYCLVSPGYNVRMIFKETSEYSYQQSEFSLRSYQLSNYPL